MDLFGECIKCVELNKSLQVEKKKVDHKDRLITLLKELVRSFEAKDLNLTLNDVSRVYESSASEVTILKQRLSLYLNENQQLLQTKCEAVSRSDEFEKKFRGLEEEASHLRFVNKQLSEYYTEKETDKAHDKDRLKMLARKILTFDPRNSDARKILNLQHSPIELNQKPSKNKKKAKENSKDTKKDVEMAKDSPTIDSEIIEDSDFDPDISFNSEYDPDFIEVETLTSEECSKSPRKSIIENTDIINKATDKSVIMDESISVNPIQLQNSVNDHMNGTEGNLPSIGELGCSFSSGNNEAVENMINNLNENHTHDNIKGFEHTQGNNLNGISLTLARSDLDSSDSDSDELGHIAPKFISPPTSVKQRISSRASKNKKRESKSSHNMPELISPLKSVEQESCSISKNVETILNQTSFVALPKLNFDRQELIPPFEQVEQQVCSIHLGVQETISNQNCITSTINNKKDLNEKNDKESEDIKNECSSNSGDHVNKCKKLSSTPQSTKYLNLNDGIYYNGKEINGSNLPMAGSYPSNYHFQNPDCTGCCNNDFEPRTPIILKLNNCSNIEINIPPTLQKQDLPLITIGDKLGRQKHIGLSDVNNIFESESNIQIRRRYHNPSEENNVRKSYKHRERSGNGNDPLNAFPQQNLETMENCYFQDYILKNKDSFKRTPIQAWEEIEIEEVCCKLRELSLESETRINLKFNTSLNSISEPPVFHNSLQNPLSSQLKSNEWIFGESLTISNTNTHQGFSNRVKLRRSDLLNSETILSKPEQTSNILKISATNTNFANISQLGNVDSGNSEEIIKTPENLIQLKKIFGKPHFRSEVSSNKVEMRPSSLFNNEQITKNNNSSFFKVINSNIGYKSQFKKIISDSNQENLQDDEQSIGVQKAVEKSFPREKGIKRSFSEFSHEQENLSSWHTVIRNKKNCTAAYMLPKNNGPSPSITKINFKHSYPEKGINKLVDVDHEVSHFSQAPLIQHNNSKRSHETFHNFTKVISSTPINSQPNHSRFAREFESISEVSKADAGLPKQNSLEIKNVTTNEIKTKTPPLFENIPSSQEKGIKKSIFEVNLENASSPGAIGTDTEQDDDDSFEMTCHESPFLVEKNSIQEKGIKKSILEVNHDNARTTDANIEQDEQDSLEMTYKDSPFLVEKNSIQEKGSSNTPVKQDDQNSFEMFRKESPSFVEKNSSAKKKGIKKSIFEVNLEKASSPGTIGTDIEQDDSFEITCHESPFLVEKNSIQEKGIKKSIFEVNHEKASSPGAIGTDNEQDDDDSFETTCHESPFLVEKNSIQEKGIKKSILEVNHDNARTTDANIEQDERDSLEMTYKDSPFLVEKDSIQEKGTLSTPVKQDDQNSFEMFRKESPSFVKKNSSTKKKGIKKSIFEVNHEKASSPGAIGTDNEQDDDDSFETTCHESPFLVEKNSIQEKGLKKSILEVNHDNARTIDANIEQDERDSLEMTYKDSPILVEKDSIQEKDTSSTPVEQDDQNSFEMFRKESPSFVEKNSPTKKKGIKKSILEVNHDNARTTDANIEQDEQDSLEMTYKDSQFLVEKNSIKKKGIKKSILEVNHDNASTTDAYIEQDKQDSLKMIYKESPFLVEKNSIHEKGIEKSIFEVNREKATLPGTSDPIIEQDDQNSFEIFRKESLSFFKKLSKKKGIKKSISEVNREKASLPRPSGSRLEQVDHDSFEMSCDESPSLVEKNSSIQEKGISKSMDELEAPFLVITEQVNVSNELNTFKTHDKSPSPLSKKISSSIQEKGNLKLVLNSNLEHELPEVVNNYNKTSSSCGLDSISHLEKPLSSLNVSKKRKNNSPHLIKASKKKQKLDEISIVENKLLVEEAIITEKNSIKKVKGFKRPGGEPSQKTPANKSKEMEGNSDESGPVLLSSKLCDILLNSKDGESDEDLESIFAEVIFPELLSPISSPEKLADKEIFNQIEHIGNSPEHNYLLEEFELLIDQDVSVPSNSAVINDNFKIVDRSEVEKTNPQDKTSSSDETNNVTINEQNIFSSISENDNIEKASKPDNDWFSKFIPKSGNVKIYTPKRKQIHNCNFKKKLDEKNLFKVKKFENIDHYQITEYTTPQQTLISSPIPDHYSLNENDSNFGVSINKMSLGEYDSIKPSLNFNFYVNQAGSSKDIDSYKASPLKESGDHKYKVFYDEPDEIQDTLQTKTEEIVKTKFFDQEIDQDLMYKGPKLVIENGCVSCENNVFLCAMKYLSEAAINSEEAIYSEEAINSDSDNACSNVDIEKLAVRIAINYIKNYIWNLVNSTQNFYETLNATVEKIINLNKSTCVTLAKAIIDLISDNDDSDEFRSRPFVPGLTKTVKTCLQVAVSYVGLNREMVMEFLEVFDQHMSSFHDKELTVKDGVQIAAFYTSFCRSYNLDDKVKILIYDVLYSRSNKAYPIVHKIIITWPDIMPHSQNTIDKECLLTETISYLLLSNSDNQIHGVQKTFFNLRNHLQKFFGYSLDITRKDDLANKIIGKITNQGGSLALVLLCKCLTWEWACTVVEKKLLPILHSFSKLDELTLCEYLITAGRIIRGFPATKSAHIVKRALEIFEKILHESKTTHLSEIVIEAISLIRRHNIMQCTSILLKWTPNTKQVTEKTIKHIRNILSVKSIEKWKYVYSLHFNDAEILRKTRFKNY